jgi:uncharacterized membrane protein
MMRSLVLLGLAAAISLAAAPAQAAQVCNQTSYVIQTAVGWDVEGGVTVRGWTRIRPGECVNAPDELDREGDAPLYLYARTSAAYPDGVREWRGDQRLCVDETDFDLVSNGRCESLGLQERAFLRLFGGQRDRATLTEPANYGERALQAGQQRLLSAAGQNISAIDGFAGRRTRNAVAAFLEGAGIEDTPSDPELIDALEAAALRRNAGSGITFCNDASVDIATAIGRRNGERWESRGWWRLQPGECARVLAQRLESPDAHFYAERLSAGERRPLAGGDEEFCLSPSRFLAEGRTDCAQRGYGRALFRPVGELENGGVRLSLGDEDFEATE